MSGQHPSPVQVKVVLRQESHGFGVSPVAHTGEKLT